MENQEDEMNYAGVRRGSARWLVWNRNTEPCHP